MTSLYVIIIVRAIMNFPGSHGYSIIKNLLALLKNNLVLVFVFIDKNLKIFFFISFSRTKTFLIINIFISYAKIIGILSN